MYLLIQHTALPKRLTAKYLVMEHTVDDTARLVVLHIQYSLRKEFPHYSAVQLSASIP